MDQWSLNGQYDNRHNVQWIQTPCHTRLLKFLKLVAYVQLQADTRQRSMTCIIIVRKHCATSWREPHQISASCERHSFSVIGKLLRQVHAHLWRLILHQGLKSSWCLQNCGASSKTASHSWDCDQLKTSPFAIFSWRAYNQLKPLFTCTVPVDGHIFQ